VNNNCDNPPCTYGDASDRSLQHARLWRRQNLEQYSVRSAKSKAELAVDRRRIAVLKLMTDTEHRAASLRQQSYLLRPTFVRYISSEWKTPCEGFRRDWVGTILKISDLHYVTKNTWSRFWYVELELSKDFWHTYYLGHRRYFLVSHLTYLVQLLYLEKLSRPKYPGFSLKLLIFPMLQY